MTPGKPQSDTGSPRTLAELVAHYRPRTIPKWSRRLTAHERSYSPTSVRGSFLSGEAFALTDVKTVEVEAWLGTLPLTNGCKAKIRNVMSAIFTHAMRYEWLRSKPDRTGPSECKAGAIAGRSHGCGNRIVVRRIAGPLPYGGATGIVYGVTSFANCWL